MTDTVKPIIRELPLDAIDEPVLPSRTSMDDAKLDELVASIRAIGFISVLVVVQLGPSRFAVVAGHRRRIAAARAGLVSVPCLVYPSEAAALDAIQHAENRHREELSVADEAIWFAQLLEKYPSEGTDGVAARVGESRDYVEGRLLLLRGDEAVFAALGAGQITIGVAQVLNQVTRQDYRRMYLDMAVTNGVTVATARQWLWDYKKIHEPAAGSVTPAPASAAAPMTSVSFFRCVVCERDDDAGHMTQFSVHDYCAKSRLNVAIAAARAGADFVEFPRTREEAIALHTRLTQRFPELFADAPA